MDINPGTGKYEVLFPGKLQKGYSMVVISNG